MGCWNITFWDNDECFEFLLYLFQHMGLMPFPSQRMHAVGVMKNKVNKNILMVRHSEEEYDQVQNILASITSTTLDLAKVSDPQFKEKLFADNDFASDGLERVGLTREHMWTLIHMHVGAPVAPEDLAVVAKAFHTRKKGGSWSIDPFLRSLTHATLNEIEEVRNKHAPFIRKGILEYKDRVEKGEALQPMKLAFIGPLFSQLMWFEGLLPESLPPQLVWKHYAVASSFVKLPKADPTFDRRKCSACHSLETGRDKPLMQCPCQCAFYCDKVCQKKHWKGHRRLHKLRMNAHDVVYEEEGVKDKSTAEEREADGDVTAAEARAKMDQILNRK